MVTEVEARLSVHEAVCAQRYEGINARLKRLEKILIGTADQGAGSGRGR